MTKLLPFLAVALLACSEVRIVGDDGDDNGNGRGGAGGAAEPPTDPPTHQQWVASEVVDREMLFPREVLLRDGETIVVGMVSRDSGLSLLIRSVAPDRTFTTMDERSASAAGHLLNMVVGATDGFDGGLVVLATVVADTPTSWLLFYDAAGQLFSEYEVPGIEGRDLTVDRVAGNVGIVGIDWRDPSGEVAVYLTATSAGLADLSVGEGPSAPGLSPVAESVIAHPDGGLVATKWDYDSDNLAVHSEIVWAFGPHGIEIVEDDACGPLLAGAPGGIIYTASSPTAGGAGRLCKWTYSDGSGWSREEYPVEYPGSSLFGITGIGAIGETGEVVIGGWAEPADGSFIAEMFTRAYDADGQELWQDQYRGEDGNFAFGMTLATEPDRIVQAGVVSRDDTKPYDTTLRTLTP
ncbi:MAG: hypothetical protein U0271_26520 [Polyangiaceae bacterium]